MVTGGFILASMLCIGSFFAPESPAQSSQADEEPEPEPPKGQTYIGSKKCSACHFDQYMTWRKEKHAKAYEVLPAKYKNDSECLKCHTTGYGHDTGFKTSADKDLAAVSCEVCHGPGSKHAETCKPLALVKTLSPEQKKAANDSIYRMLPQNICVKCHLMTGHRKHPEYDK